MTDDALLKKLGLRPELASATLHAPKNYSYILPLPRPLFKVDELANNTNWLQAFYYERTTLETEIELLKNCLALDGQLWLCWPKKASGVKTDLSDNIVREIGLTAGLVDVKVAAIDDTWSGLKFVYRLVDRKQ